VCEREIPCVVGFLWSRVCVWRGLGYGCVYEVCVSVCSLIWGGYD